MQFPNDQEPYHEHQEEGEVAESRHGRRWDVNEDNILRNHFDSYGPTWDRINLQLGRTVKACAMRWNRHLRHRPAAAPAAAPAAEAADEIPVERDFLSRIEEAPAAEAADEIPVERDFLSRIEEAPAEAPVEAADEIPVEPNFLSL